MIEYDQVFKAFACLVFSQNNKAIKSSENCTLTREKKIGGKMDIKTLEVVKNGFVGDFRIDRIDSSFSLIEISRFLVGTVGVKRVGEVLMGILSDRRTYPEPFSDATINLFKNLIVLYAAAIRVDGRSTEDEEFCANLLALLDQFV